MLFIHFPDCELCDGTNDGAKFPDHVDTKNQFTLCQDGQCALCVCPKGEEYDEIQERCV